MQGHSKLNIKAFKTNFLWYLDPAGITFHSPKLQLILGLNNTKQPQTSAINVGHPQDGRHAHK